MQCNEHMATMTKVAQGDSEGTCGLSTNGLQPMCEGTSSGSNRCPSRCKDREAQKFKFMCMRWGGMGESGRREDCATRDWYSWQLSHTDTVTEAFRYWECWKRAQRSGWPYSGCHNCHYRSCHWCQCGHGCGRKDWLRPAETGPVVVHLHIGFWWTATGLSPKLIGLQLQVRLWPVAVQSSCDFSQFTQLDF